MPGAPLLWWQPCHPHGARPGAHLQAEAGQHLVGRQAVVHGAALPPGTRHGSPRGKSHPGGVTQPRGTLSCHPACNTDMASRGAKGGQWPEPGQGREWGRGLYSPQSPRAPTQRRHGSGCGRAAVCSCALPRPPAPAPPPPSAPGTPPSWALHRRWLRAPGTKHRLPSTGHGTPTQGMALRGSPTPPASTTHCSTVDALPWPGNTNTYLGTGGQQPVPRATSSLRGQGVSRQGGTVAAAAGHAGDSPGTRCHWLSLRGLCELIYAVTWSSEPSGASKHRKVTQPWAGKPPPRCGEAPAPPSTHLPGAQGTGPLLPQRCAGASTHIPTHRSARGLWAVGTLIPGTPHLRTRDRPGRSRARGAQTSTATQREEAYVCPESSSSPVTLGWDEAAPSIGDHRPPSSLSSAPGMPDGAGRRRSPVPGGRARRRRTSRQGEQAMGPLQRSAGFSRSRARAGPRPSPGSSVPHSTSVSGGRQRAAMGEGPTPQGGRRAVAEAVALTQEAAGEALGGGGGEAGGRSGVPAGPCAGDTDPPGSRPGCRGGPRAHPPSPPPPAAAAATPACAWRGRGRGAPRPHAVHSRRPRSRLHGPHRRRRLPLPAPIPDTRVLVRCRATAPGWGLPTPVPVPAPTHGPPPRPGRFGAPRGPGAAPWLGHRTGPRGGATGRAPAHQTDGGTG